MAKLADKLSGAVGGKKKRKARQGVKERYAKAREDAQLAGVIPTAPEGAVRDEKVDPLTQGEQELVGIDRAAVNKGWAVPENEKQGVIGRLIQKVYDEESSAKEVAVCASVVLRADQIQYERDHPDEAGKAKGGTKVDVTFNWDAIMKGLVEAPNVNAPRIIEDAARSVELSAVHVAGCEAVQQTG